MPENRNQKHPKTRLQTMLTSLPQEQIECCLMSVAAPPFLTASRKPTSTTWMSLSLAAVTSLFFFSTTAARTDMSSYRKKVVFILCVPCCHNQPKVGNDFFELISSSDAEEKELSSKSKIVFLWLLFNPQLHILWRACRNLFTEIIVIKVSDVFFMVYNSILLATISANPGHAFV